MCNWRFQSMQAAQGLEWFQDSEGNTEYISTGDIAKGDHTSDESDAPDISLNGMLLHVLQNISDV